MQKRSYLCSINAKDMDYLKIYEEEHIKNRLSYSQIREKYNISRGTWDYWIRQKLGKSADQRKYVCKDDFFDNFEGKVDKSKLQIFKRNIGLQINSQNSICIYHNKFYDTKKNKDQYEKEISSKKISVDDLFTKGEEALTKSLDEEDDKNLSKDPKVVEIKRIFKVNEYLKVENKKQLWYIYHTAGKSSFGPLTSENIEQMYNSKMLNGESEVRLIDIYGVDEGDNFKHVKLKEVEKSGFIKRICISKQGKNAFEVLMKK